MISNTSKIFMDVRVNDYSFNGEIISIGFMDNTQYKRVLYLENSDYDEVSNTGWLPGDNAVSNRYLANGNMTFKSNIQAEYVSKAEFTNTIETWLTNYAKVQIYTNTPLSWMYFVSLYGGIEDLPNKISPVPIMLPSILLANNINPETELDDLDQYEEGPVVKYNALHTVHALNRSYNCYLTLSRI